MYYVINVRINKSRKLELIKMVQFIKSNDMLYNNIKTNVTIKV